MRGEYRGNPFSPCAQSELPPRARRILVRKTQKGHHHGTTSACAENTARWLCVASAFRNYLRVRGEYLTVMAIDCLLAELPPRARRILGVAFSLSCTIGTTSACAENTGHRTTIRSIPWNYLRVRGEYLVAPLEGGRIMELPPRARRIPACDLLICSRSGTTSACAENTRGNLGGDPELRNYLRVRGEYLLLSASEDLFLELPPRARRIPSEASTLKPCYGTTSACAENTAP